MSSDPRLALAAEYVREFHRVNGRPATVLGIDGRKVAIETSESMPPARFSKPELEIALARFKERPDFSKVPPAAPSFDAILEEIPERPQRQDALGAQLRDLIAVANRLGMYDAADCIRSRLL